MCAVGGLIAENALSNTNKIHYGLRHITLMWHLAFILWPDGSAIARQAIDS